MMRLKGKAAVYDGEGRRLKRKKIQSLFVRWQNSLKLGFRHVLSQEHATGRVRGFARGMTWSRYSYHPDVKLGNMTEQNVVIVIMAVASEILSLITFFTIKRFDEDKTMMDVSLKKVGAYDSQQNIAGILLDLPSELDDNVIMCSL